MAQAGKSTTEAKQMASQILGLNYTELINHRQKLVSDQEYHDFQSYLLERAQGKPLQYIFRQANFYGYDFYVDHRVLIPRPETERLVELAIEWVSRQLDRGSQQPIKLLDLCTGSGCIGITLMAELIKKYGAERIKADLQLEASDISSEALSVARQNAKRIVGEGAIDWINSDLFEAIERTDYDLIISNPPYISAQDKKDLPTEVIDYEPENALIGGNDGLEFYRRIIQTGYDRLSDQGRIMLEIGYNQKQEVIDLLNQNQYCKIKTYSDYNRLDRIVVAQKAVMNQAAEPS